MDLSLAASYLVDRSKDKDVAGANGCMGLKMGKGHVYAPGNGLTTPVSRLKHDLAALKRLLDFEIPHLRVVWPFQVVQVFYAFRERQYSNLVPPSLETTIAEPGL